ncbi:MAG: SDR family NAD(P)-dependent oxidoreductase [Candidatus Elarobacter sp.]
MKRTAAPTEAVVVTGASSGIGAATAVAAAQAGFLTFAGVRRDVDARHVETLHPNVRAVRIDVTDAASIAAAAELVAASGLALRGAVSNAGIAVAGPMEFLPVDQLRRQFEVNVFGSVEVAQAFLPQLRRSRGRLVFVGSISGRLAVPFIAPYSASKFALRAIVDAMRVELRPAGIAVALIEPSSVKTPIWQKGRDSRGAMLGLLPPQAMERYRTQIEAVFRSTESEERIAIPVERVSQAILHALTARKPRSSYLIGAPARAGSLIAHLPAGLRDRALRRR